jgi:group II intron reverse transcriptase/maturase
MAEAKPYSISKQLVVRAWQLVRANRGAAGVDGESLAMFEKDLKGNLYRIWNRMSSGSYFPPPVRLVEIPKRDGKLRPLGIPTVADRVAQTVAKIVLEPLVESIFHPDSYGYRPNKSALDAVGQARKRCLEMDWVIDLDIRNFFGSLDHELLMKALRHRTDLKWLHLYVERWLKAPLQRESGTLEARNSGTPQGGVISPILANLYMHYAFDEWMRRNLPRVSFERYADDVVIHCASLDQAKLVLGAVGKRLTDCRLELHPEKTKIVYCKDDRRRGDYSQRKFDFLGYTFRPRTSRSPGRKPFVGFLPAISDKASKQIRTTIRDWRLKAWGTSLRLADVAERLNPAVRGWVAYYGRFYRSKCLDVLGHYLTETLVRWAMRKYKRFRCKWGKAYCWLGAVAARYSNLFYHWNLGLRPSAGR